MNRKSHLSPRQLLTACIILILFTLLTFTVVSLSSGDRAFRLLCDELFQEEMNANTLSMHYTLAYPESFGIENYRPTLPCFTENSTQEDRKRLTYISSRLHRIDPQRLSAESRLSYLLLQRSVELDMKLAEFPYYSEPLSPTQGVQSQLPILLGEYTFRSKTDVEDYFCLLSQVEDYFDSLLLYENKKREAGTLLSASGLLQSARQCDTIVTNYALEEGTHFLQTGFRERLQELAKKVPLTQEEMDAYILENERLLSEQVLSAYQKLGVGLRELARYAPDTCLGLAHLPNGREYYALLLSKETGSPRTPDQVKELLEETFQKEYQAIKRLLEEYPDCAPSLQEESYAELGFSDTAALLADLTSRISKDFPKPCAETDAMYLGYPPAILKTVSPSLQDCSAPAYYLTAPIDDTDNNVIYLNPKNAGSQLELYTTLAHEGYPGHLYQNAYYAKRMLQSLEENKPRILLWYGGYLEGWALYVEFYSFDYASRLLQEQGRPADGICVQIEKHNRSLQLCLYSLLDLKIHQDGASLSQICQYLEGLGLCDPDAAAGIYEYICHSPCNYLKYYLGYLEILNLKETARELWGMDDTDLLFHRFLLDVGPADFTTLQEELSHYSPKSL